MRYAPLAVERLVAAVFVLLAYAAEPTRRERVSRRGPSGAGERAARALTQERAPRTVRRLPAENRSDQTQARGAAPERRPPARPPWPWDTFHSGPIRGTQPGQSKTKRPTARSEAIGRAPSTRGMGGERKQWHGQSAAAPVPSFVSPLGGMEVKQGAASVRARCRADGGPDVAWQPSRARGQCSGDAVSAAARTGPRAAAQTGTQFRPLVRKPVVAWTPPRRCLRGVSHGGAVDDGGVGPRPAPPHDPAASALCRKRGYGSLGHRSGVRHGRRPPRCARGRQRQARAVPYRCLSRPRHV